MKHYNGKRKPPRPLSAALFFGFALLFWFLVWQFAAARVQLALLLPAPGQVLRRLAELLQEAAFWQVVLASLRRIFFGYALAVVLGSLLAVLTAFLPSVRQVIAFPMNIIKASPVASFVILALIWIASDTLPLFICFLMVLPMVWSNVETGIREADENLLEMAWVYRFSLPALWRTVYLPAIKPFFTTACLVGFGFAWKSGVAAEVLSLPRLGIGTKLYQAKIYLETADLFAWTIVVISISISFEFLLSVCLQKKRRKPAE
ncbi:MAG: ABC transporter permease subunit [Negativicutes bacterium]|nr:ABC transporter permease subunit [Negativicutes bacterium]